MLASTPDSSSIPSRRFCIAVVGCGAIAREGHLPGAMLLDDVEVTLLVDRDIKRAELLQSEFGVGNVSTDISQVAAQADAAILALPHHLHEPIGTALLKSGVHVLIEKPLARTRAECDALISAAAATNSTLAVAMVRRFFPGDQFASTFLKAAPFGPVRSFYMGEGCEYSWPSQTPFLLDRELSGGGTLIGNGSHVLDLLFWWFGRPESWYCESDSLDRVETDCRLHMTYAGGMQGVVELSRLRPLSNSLRVEFDEMSFELPRFSTRPKLIGKSFPYELDCQIRYQVRSEAYSTFGLADAMAAQIADFRRAATTGAEPVVSGRAAAEVVEFVENCYRAATLQRHPWSDVPEELMSIL